VVKKKYKADIGLEVHVELATRSKMFCSCAVVDTTSAPPNSSVCEICCGMPGTLPIINRTAVQLAMKAALALNCIVVETSIFARKNYFYPDLPKGYQISQYEYPLAVNGHILITTPEGERTIRIRRAHLEEDTGKLTHISNNGETYSLVDLNRAGVPLLEIVTEPDMHSVDDVRAYSRGLRSLLRWIGVSSGDMEKGTMRFEANLSMRPEGSDELGTRVEIKNLNSFKAMEQAILYQMEIQRAKLVKGERVKQQTLGWSESQGKSIAQRSKEDANDYRYFPEPDLPPLVVTKTWVDEVKESLPELPDTRRMRYSGTYGLNAEDIERLLEDKSVSDYFDACLSAAPKLSPKKIANWVLTDLFAWLNLSGTTFEEMALPPVSFIRLVAAVDKGTINQNTGKEILAEMLAKGKSAEAIIEEKGLVQVSDENLITDLVFETLEANSGEVRSYLNGKETVSNWLFGQVMRSAQGKANPQVVKKELNRQLENLKKQA
jgi:aspartyl-tRNA(Asn)/glutamyl-tRNA(Gln) amidotransferase subunit B